MRDDLQRALISWIRSDADVMRLATGGVWYGRAPEDDLGVRPPYVVITEIAGTPTITMSDISDNSLVQCSIWDTSRSTQTIHAIAKALKARLDEARFPVDDSVIVDCERRGEVGPIPVPDDVGWQFTIDYFIRTDSR